MKRSLYRNELEELRRDMEAAGWRRATNAGTYVSPDGHVVFVPAVTSEYLSALIVRDVRTILEGTRTEPKPRPGKDKAAILVLAAVIIFAAGMLAGGSFVSAVQSGAKEVWNGTKALE